MSKSKKIKGDFKRQRRNRAVKASIKSTIGALNKAALGKDTNSANEALKKAIRLLDRAAAKSVIHPNVAARKKSRLTRKVNSLSHS